MNAHDPAFVAAAAPRKRWFWTAAEVAILQEHYPRGGVPACGTLLPGRDDRAIYSKAHALGLHKPNWVKDLSYQRYKTSPQIDDIIRRGYADARKGYTKRIARTIRRPDWWVTMRAARLGLSAPRTKPPPWTPEEDRLLTENTARSLPTLVRMLKRRGFVRTPTAVTIRLKRLGLPTGRNAEIDRYTANQLAGLMGVDRAVVRRWIATDMLKASRAGTARIPEQGGDEYRIHRRDVRRFVIDNAAAVDLRKVEKFWFIDMMAERGA